MLNQQQTIHPILGLGIILLLGICYIGCGPSSAEKNADVSNYPMKEMPLEPATKTERPISEVIDLSEDVPLFIVVAGAYSTLEGALTKVEGLKKLGFANADTIQRPGSKLYSALVERFDSKARAESFAEELLTDEKIKSYVYPMK